MARHAVLATADAVRGCWVMAASFSEYLTGLDDVDEFLVSDQTGFAFEEQVHPVSSLALCEERRTLHKCLGFSKHLEACARDSWIINLIARGTGKIKIFHIDR
jgi:hypothetical protein